MEGAPALHVDAGVDADVDAELFWYGDWSEKYEAPGDR
jgi:hypothetical protein